MFLSLQPHSCEYQVLVLGLDGAGKSSILHYISSVDAKKHLAPTQGFNSVQLQTSGFQMDLLEGKFCVVSWRQHYLEGLNGRALERSGIFVK